MKKLLAIAVLSIMFWICRDPKNTTEETVCMVGMIVVAAMPDQKGTHDDSSRTSTRD